MSPLEISILAITGVAAGYAASRATDPWTAIGLAIAASFIISLGFACLTLVGATMSQVNDYIGWSIFVAIKACFITAPISVGTAILSRLKRS